MARWAWIAAAGTAVFGLLQLLFGPPTTPAAPWGIISFELAGDVGSAQAILDLWNPAGRRQAILSLFLDFPYLVAYAFLLWHLCRWAAEILGEYSPRAGALGRLLAWGQLAAGVCDAIEDVTLLVELFSRQVVAPWPQIALVFAVTKFVLLTLGIAYILVGVRFLPDANTVLGIANTIRFSLGVSLLGPLLFFVGQSQESLRVLGEDAGVETWKVSVFFVAALLSALMSWYWARVLLYLLQPGRRLAGGAPGWTAKNLPRLCAAVPLALFAIALFVASHPVAPQDDPQGKARVRTPGDLELLRMGWGMLALAVLVIGALYLRRKYLLDPRTEHRERELRAIGQQWHVKDLDPGTLAILAVTFLPGLLLFLAFWPRGTLGSQWTSNFGPMAILLIGLGLFVPIGSSLVYAGERMRLPFLSLLILAAVAFSAFDLNDNHGVRLLPNPEASVPPSVGDTFTKWLNKRADRLEYLDATAHPGGYPVFLVAAEGGGLRAAYQTAHVLAAVQDQNPAFAQHLFAISGVSGGSLGAAVFAALASRYTSNTPTRAPRLPLPRQNGEALGWVTITEKVLQRDMLSPPLAALLSPEVVQRFLPFAVDHSDPGRFDRARALEAAFEKAWDEGTRDEDGTTRGNEFAAPLSNLASNFANRCVPALFINTTHVETGDRMVISTLRPSDPGFSGLQSLADVNPTAALRLSTAVGLSARFPVITPAGYLPVCRLLTTQPPTPTLAKFRYVDGGYFENSGVTTLSDLLIALRAGPTAPLRPRWYPVILRIGFAGGEEQSLRACPPTVGAHPRRPRRSDGFEEAFTPFKALYNTRDARGAAAFERLKTQVALMRKDRQPVELFEFEFRERTVPLPLGWLLSSRARSEMRAQIACPGKAVPASKVHPVVARNCAAFQGVLGQLK